MYDPKGGAALRLLHPASIFKVITHFVIPSAGEVQIALSERNYTPRKDSYVDGDRNEGILLVPRLHLISVRSCSSWTVNVLVHCILGFS